jgi:hypothetical protein
LQALYLHLKRTTTSAAIFLAIIMTMKAMAVTITEAIMETIMKAETMGGEVIIMKVEGGGIITKIIYSPLHPRLLQYCSGRTLILYKLFVPLTAFM